jgi:preprotein translocase subunit SecD
LIANIALVFNLVFLCALLSMLGATLTLPGIAGIVLTLGMAVDANVLINERIREELRAGVSVQAAIYAGYERAFAAILDANLTTFIVGAILFAVGTGPVKGFAVTLTIGLLTSMITGVTYTRAIVNAIYGRRKHLETLSIGL